MIEISVVTYNNAAPSGALSASFDAQGGTIGRSDDNWFVLPDPKHHVSRFQASITSDGEQHAITNLSHANPTRLNGIELPCDVAHPLRHGDAITIGLYVLRADVVRHAARLPTRAAVATASVAPATNAAPQAQPASRPAPALHAAATNALCAVESQPALPARTETVAEDAAPVDLQALLQAFLKGAGIPDISLSSGLTPELMEMLGGLLACAIDGTVDLIGMRALVKREVKADVTMVVVRKNNPLKFLPDGATVLTQMLRKRMPGFMGPVEAMQDAYQDLHAHQLGTEAGMQAAMRSLHHQLDPATLERSAGPVSMVERLLPARRKVRAWNRYCAVHRQTGAALAADAHAVAGKAFLDAYERASERYKDEVADER
jgi:FHA domain-containing protein